MQLLEIQKTNENNRCVDCNAPSPQWVCLYRRSNHYDNCCNPLAMYVLI